MIVMTALAVWLLIWRAPATPIGRWCISALVEAPARLLSRITRGQILVTVALMLAIGGIVAFLDQEALLIASFMSPELAGWMIAADIATYADVIATLAVVATTTRLRTIMPLVRRTMVRSHRIGRRGHRTRAARPTGANDDDHPVLQPLRNLTLQNLFAIPA